MYLPLPYQVMKIVINKVTRNDWINKAEEEIEK